MGRPGIFSQGGLFHFKKGALMGRTLHYELRRNPAITLTDKDWNRIEKLTDFFNKTFKFTCENIGFNTLGFYPRWHKFFKDSKLHDDKSGWDIVNSSYKNLQAKGHTRLQILRALHKHKLIAYYKDDDRLNLQVARGFTKVAGNEWNALLVTVWLTEVSKILTDNEFELHDEGEFLKVDIIMKNGKARPNIPKLLERIRWFSEKIDKGVDIYRKDRDKARAVFETFKDCGWQEISYFCRPVNSADFNEHPEFTGVAIAVDNGKVSSNSGQVMAGFYGEYYGHISETEAKYRSKQAFDHLYNLLFKRKESNEDRKNNYSARSRG